MRFRLWVLELCGIATLVGFFVWAGEFRDEKWMNHDVANALYVGKRMVEGDLLYVDWSYYVMPPVVLLSSAACWLARWIGLSPPTVMHLLLVSTAGVGWLVIRGLVATHGLRAAALFLAYLAVTIHAGFKPPDFAQREHFFVLLFIPYFLWRIGRGRGSLPMYAVLVMLGFASMVKPHFVAAVAVTEGFCLGRRDRKFWVWGLVLAGALLPFVGLAMHSTEAFAAFFARAIPYHLSGSYDDFSTPVATFLASGNHARGVALALVMLVGGAVCVIRQIVPLRVVVAAGVLAAVFYASILHQQKFFAYHQLPFVAFSFVLVAGFWGAAIESFASKRVRWAAGAVVLSLALLVVGKGFASMTRLVLDWPNAHTRPLLPLLQDQERIALMSPVVEGGVFSYALSHGLEIMKPWTSNYTVASLLRLDDPVERKRAIREYFAPIAQRLREDRPDLVVFSPFAWKGPNMHEVFVEQYRLFPTRHYVFWKRTKNGWRVYRRIANRS